VAKGAPVLKRSYQVTSGVVLICIALFFLASFVGYHAGDHSRLLREASVQNFTGPVGAWTGHLLRLVFGTASYGIPALMILSGLFLIRAGRARRATEQVVLVLTMTISLSAILTLFISGIPQLSGGYTGMYIARFLTSLAGRDATYLIVSGILIVNITGLILIIVLPGHERIAANSAEVRGLMYRLFFLRKKSDIPLLKLGNNSSFPWILRKRIIILETEKVDRHQYSFNIPEITEEREEKNIRMHDEVQGQLLIEQDGGNAGCAGVEREVVLREEDYQIDDSTTRMTGELCQTADAPVETDNSNDCAANEAPVDSEEDVAVMPDTEGTAEPDIVQEESCHVDLEKHVFDEVPLNEEYIIPVSYLTSSRPQDSESWKNEIRKNSRLLKSTLAEFGIEADVVNVNRGPVITLYEMQIAPGIKVTRVASLAHRRANSWQVGDRRGDTQQVPGDGDARRHSKVK
jgi:DNA segregation ATPase FtsK/SpoIIIE-like protein